MESGEILRRLSGALGELVRSQWQLADLALGERTITSHLFRLVVDSFADTGYDVDHEYNRRGSLTKYLTYGTGDDEGEHRIYPDIVIHRRNRADANLVAIEVKKGFQTDENDYEKIRALLSDDHYLYDWGILLALGIGAGASRGVSWVPRWTWLRFDSTNSSLVEERSELVFDEHELLRLDAEGSAQFG